MSENLPEKRAIMCTRFTTTHPAETAVMPTGADRFDAMSEVILDGYRNGLSIPVLARQLKVKAGFVRDLLRENEVTLRHRRKRGGGRRARASRGTADGASGAVSRCASPSVDREV